MTISSPAFIFPRWRNPAQRLRTAATPFDSVRGSQLLSGGFRVCGFYPLFEGSIPSEGSIYCGWMAGGHRAAYICFRDEFNSRSRYQTIACGAGRYGGFEPPRLRSIRRRAAKRIGHVLGTARSPKPSSAVRFRGDLPNTVDRQTGYAASLQDVVVEFDSLVNYQTKGKALREVLPNNAPVAQLEEAADLSPAQCEFESHWEHQTKALWWNLVDAPVLETGSFGSVGASPTRATNFTLCSDSKRYFVSYHSSETGKLLRLFSKCVIIRFCL